MKNLSHEALKISLDEIVANLRKTKQKDVHPLLDSLLEFELGRFLLVHGGLSGEWTEYINSYPDKRFTPKNDLEAYILQKAPIALAMQERYRIFRKILQKSLFEDCHFASLPCGMMSDLLDLDYSKLERFHLTGIDLDPQTLEQAKERARDKNLLLHTTFLERDAWHLELEANVDLLTSNGLSFYEKDDQKVTDLYRSFHSVLKKGGVLLTSFLTPHTSWQYEKIVAVDMQLQKLLFLDLLESKWATFRDEKTVFTQLREAGFDFIEIIYDKAHLFPTILAHKI